jgi:DNA-directed RNA polymerase subunit RPC12/RpoP
MIQMAFRFETANERWDWFKKSVDEHGNFSWDEVEDGLQSELRNTMECYGCGKQGGYDVFGIPVTCPDCGSHQLGSAKFDDHKQSNNETCVHCNKNPSASDDIVCPECRDKIDNPDLTPTQRGIREDLAAGLEIQEIKDKYGLE